MAAEDQTFCYDLHATILHLLGIVHHRLTFRHNGIDRRLTDVHGKVIRAILAWQRKSAWPESKRGDGSGCIYRRSSRYWRAP
jgi:hypothetical protein